MGISKQSYKYAIKMENVAKQSKVLSNIILPK
jgi:hypothetical protein